MDPMDCVGSYKTVVGDFVGITHVTNLIKFDHNELARGRRELSDDVKYGFFARKHVKGHIRAENRLHVDT